MLLKDMLPRLRAERGLTQQDLAEKLYVTRQAVSRWETGETAPGIDMVKLIASVFDVPIVSLLDMPEHYCQSCGMMLTDESQYAVDADGNHTHDWCKWCYDKGAYTYETDMESMIEECARRMVQMMGWKLDEAVSLLGAVLPHLERWKGEIER